jgi:hypothetical protein
MFKKTLDNKITQNPEKLKINKKQEYGGPKGLEPTRYGDWEVKGRVSDF